MLRRRNGQRGLWEVLQFGDLEPEKQMDPRLRRIDEVLKDDALVDAVLEAMRLRFPQSGRRGRRGTPAEVALRMLVLKHLKNWSYEQLEWEVKGNLVYRHFCRIDAGKVPDAKTMVRLGLLLQGPALRTVFERVVHLAVSRRVTRGRKMRVDTTVVETPIRYPSDSHLCEDVAQGVCREIERLRSLGVTAPLGFRNVRRSVTRRVREITQVSRRPIARDAKRRALQRPYRRLLTIVRHTIRQAVKAVKRAGRCRRPLSGRGQRSVRNLERLARVGQKVVAQTKERVFKGNAKSSEKLVSIFETQTKIIRRGKAGRPTEFGQMVKVQEAEGGVITDGGVVEGTDHALLVPSVERHTEVFGRVPRLVATDRGFFKMENVRRIEEMGVRCAAVPKPGHRSPSWLKHERQRSFRKARAWRAGGEARIARLKNTLGMHRTRYKGDSGVARSAHWAAIANNLMAIGVTA
jgi:IS5 family transposase